MFLSDKQLAARYSVTAPTIWRWVKVIAGFPQPVKISPGCTRWRLSEIEAFDASR